MYVFFVVLHVIICVLLCIVVLLQSSKGSGLAGAFGGGGGLPQQIFGTRGMTTLLHKLTVYLAAGFFVTSAVLFSLNSLQGRSRSIVREAAQRGAVSSDVTPAPSSDVFDPNAPAAPQPTDNAR